MRALLILLLWAVASVASAHEVRPALLTVQADADGHAVTWKQPVNAGRRLVIRPVFPDGCMPTEPVLRTEGGTVYETFRIACALDSGELRLEGLERTLTDAYVRIIAVDGSTRSALIKPSDPVMDLSVPTPPAARAYFAEGIWHILFGWDHLLFVIGLCLLVTRRQVLGVATSFTLAHSLTLVAAAVGVVSLPVRPVEILIAASIVLLAVEVVRKWRGEDGLTARRPYLVSFGIGLIHGLGFAGALSELGLPPGEELLSLVLFNVGVEAGQFAVILAALALGWGAVKASPRLARHGATLTIYAIGTVASYWLIERLAGYVV